MPYKCAEKTCCTNGTNNEFTTPPYMSYVLSLTDCSMKGSKKNNDRDMKEDQSTKSTQQAENSY